MTAHGLPAAPSTTDRPANTPNPKVFRGDIEGLRAIAVGLVLLHHVHFPGVTGGFAGVDIFFVISGYLITAGLLKEVRSTGTVSLPKFYARRARRLLPAASLVLVFTAVVGWFVMARSALADLANDVLAATFYVVNWSLAMREVDYLAEDAAPSPLQHYWSLSVEEQFYVVWPVLIIIGAFIARRLGRRRMTVIGLLLVLMLGASLVHSVLHTASDPATAYFFTTTRVWELAVGALVAYLADRARSIPRAVAEVMTAVGVVALAVAALAYTTSTPWPGSAALLPVLGTAAVILAGCSTPDTLVGRLLGVSPMRFIGGISYALYLWHWPLLIFLEELRPGSGLLTRLAVVGLAIALSWGTKLLLEDPIRYHKALSASVPKALLMGGTAMAITALVGGAVWMGAPKLTHSPDSAKGAVALVPEDQWSAAKDSGEGAGESLLIADPSSQVTTSGSVYPEPALAPEDVPSAYEDECQAMQEDTTPPGRDDCVYGAADGKTRVAVVGDSKMVQWLPALEAIARAEDWRLEVYNKSACSLSTEGKYDECEQYNEALVEQLAADAPDMVITSAGDTVNTESIAQSMVEHLTTLQDAGAQIVLVADNPSTRKGDLEGDQSVYQCMEENPDDFSACSFPANDENGNMTLEKVDEAMSGVEYVDVNDYLCPPGDDCPAAIGGMTIYRQGSHVTASYVRSLTPMLHRALIQHGVAHADEVPLEVSEEPAE
ncbi:Peptidoglycan/LPS O-acetylase OafA/YrhL, contains acyltransferase and SGNH-hydrolase domains [Kytococcus aerolatus]|uniref:Peptidoglycan/LPS O-acetylase OafA/YrhL, contains acyltransferase and SGNH-hydrolase domains n=1 Tax=Kytococcus aerolatus TaxID=592308 RepID=A0A212TH03_9MICO|nr:acyltransferase family protein [Kytococcus aerolatus]SNC65337.1 Peptidoglycan/LPS O-acetylase OafA/YrhL, contains acyltransferase and SGNH-hydrolase domains [Kytococcus aerolatus]